MDQQPGHLASQSNPVRIALLDHTATLGGGEIALYNLVTHLDRSRYAPVVLLFSAGPLAEKLRGAGIETHVEPLSAKILDTRKDSLGAGSALRLLAAIDVLRFIARLSRKLAKLNVELVHTNSLKSDLLGALPAKLNRLPLVWHLRDRIEVDYLPPLTVRLFRRLCRFLPDHLIANSAATLQTLRLPRQLPNRRGACNWARVIHDGTDHLDLWEKRRAAGLPPSNSPQEPIVGLIGRITKWKGQDIFIRAAAEVLKRFPRTRFWIIGAPLFGETEFEAELHRLADQLKASESIEFLGMRPDIPELIDQLRVVVHASTTPEPFGQVVIEAMAAAKPVIATAAGGIPEIVVDGKTGLLTPMGDVNALANATCRLLGDAKECSAFGQAGQARVRDHFTIQHTAENVQKCYDEILALPPRESPCRGPL